MKKLCFIVIWASNRGCLSHILLRTTLLSVDVSKLCSESQSMLSTVKVKFQMPSVLSSKKVEVAKGNVLEVAVFLANLTFVELEDDLLSQRILDEIAAISLRISSAGSGEIEVGS